MIRLTDVTYTYPGGITALRNVSLHIKRGEQVAVVGNNGSGKTTLALLINGVYRAASGDIRVDGLNPSDECDANRVKHTVGLVFQNPDNQLVSTTVERETAFSLENMNVPQPDLTERVIRSLEQFGLSPFIGRLTSEMSGGEKQRLALASVMVIRPNVLILDEPGSFLDESGKRQLSEAIRRLRRDNPDLTVIRITQYADIALKYRRVILLKDGEVLLDDTPSAVYDKIDVCLDAGIEVPLSFRMKKHIDFPRSANGSVPVEGAAVVHKKITVHDVSFSYDSSAPLFERLSLEIQNGFVYGVVGPSGSGKTTLLQIMAGLLKPTEGAVAYAGFENKPGAVAVSFQQSERQFFLETVDREIRFGAENIHVPDIDRVIDDTYRLIGLPRERFADRNPFMLSGGERRRLAFGTILPLGPSFLLFDEPTCALDARGIAQFKQLVAKLRIEGIGIVIVSHYGDIVFDLCDTVIVLKEGTVRGVHDKREFFARAAYADYLSEPELVAYQREVFGEVTLFSEPELAERLTL
ncbi:MAG: ATP-binding cassette domain-containing protein [candidate division Zixibacteria bacterium]|nr:ATP-binding cassette domain-containing protein [candidate division Zixibacteria bacterium]